MLQPGTVMICSYRGCRLEVREDGGRGWLVDMYLMCSCHPQTLQTSVPAGLNTLLQEARNRVDQEHGAGIQANWRVTALEFSRSNEAD